MTNDKFQLKGNFWTFFSSTFREQVINHLLPVPPGDAPVGSDLVLEVREISVAGVGC
jgi:hypothetical protein